MALESTPLIRSGGRSGTGGIASSDFQGTVPDRLGNEDAGVAGKALSEGVDSSEQLPQEYGVSGERA